MTKTIMDELVRTNSITKELIKYLSKQGIDSTWFMTKLDNTNAYGEFCAFFAETYGVYITITARGIVLYKDNIEVMGINVDLPYKGLIVFAIVSAIRYANNPF